MIMSHPGTAELPHTAKKRLFEPVPNTVKHSTRTSGLGYSHRGVVDLQLRPVLTLPAIDGRCRIPNDGLGTVPLGCPGRLLRQAKQFLENRPLGVCGTHQRGASTRRPDIT